MPTSKCEHRMRRADDTSPSARLMKYVRRPSSGLRPAEPRLGNSPPAAEKDSLPERGGEGRADPPSLKLRRGTWSCGNTSAHRADATIFGGRAATLLGLSSSLDGFMGLILGFTV